MRDYKKKTSTIISFFINLVVDIFLFVWLLLSSKDCFIVAKNGYIIMAVVIFVLVALTGRNIKTLINLMIASTLYDWLRRIALLIVLFLNYFKIGSDTFKEGFLIPVVFLAFIYSIYFKFFIILEPSKWSKIEKMVKKDNKETIRKELTNKEINSIVNLMRKKGIIKIPYIGFLTNKEAREVERVRNILWAIKDNPENKQELIKKLPPIFDIEIIEKINILDGKY